MSDERITRSDENEPGFLWNPIFRVSYLRGVIPPRRCRVCSYPMFWRGAAFVCSNACDGVRLRGE